MRVVPNVLRLALAAACVTLSACASSPSIAPQINSLTVAGKTPFAVRALERSEEQYGAQNRLLFLQDYGLLLHLNRDYRKSIAAFEQAKRLYDTLYTVSLSNTFSTWLVNDNRAPYRGEDYERAMINVFQALNFAALGDYDGALVEARNVNNVLQKFNRQYKDSDKNAYQDDAFIRMLMGLMYEAAGGNTNLNDALISYRKALDLYRSGDFPGAPESIPAVLIENALSLSQVFDRDIFASIRNEFPNSDFPPFKLRRKQAEVIIVHYDGLAPIKHAMSIPIPLPNGQLTKLAFPYYQKRRYETTPGVFQAVSSTGQTYKANTQVAENIGALAVQSLADRKARVIAKAVLRASGKAATQYAVSKEADDRWGQTAGNTVRYLSNLYNLMSEQADLRSWQTLPDRIRVARLILPPGTYKLELNGVPVETLTLLAGDKRFLTRRTFR